MRCFDGGGAVRENVGGDVLASLTTMVWNAPSKSWTGGATMADASLNRRMTVRLGDAVAFAQIGVVHRVGRAVGAMPPGSGRLRTTDADARVVRGERGRQARPAGQLYPAKQRPEQKIDAAVALMMAVGRAMAEDTNEGDLMDFLRNPLVA